MKLKSHSGVLSYLQDSTANLAHLAVILGPVLVGLHKTIVRIQFIDIFAIPSLSRHKNIVKYWKDFLLYSTL